MTDGASLPVAALVIGGLPADSVTELRGGSIEKTCLLGLFQIIR